MTSEIKPLCYGGGKCSALAYSADSQRIAAAFEDGVLVVVERHTGREVKKYQGLGWIVALDWLLDSSTIVGLTRDGMIAVLSLASDRPERTFSAHDKAGRCLRRLASMGPNVVVSGGNDAALRVWDVSDASLLANVDHGGDVSSIHVAPDGSGMFAAVTLGDEEGSCWDFTNGENPMTFLSGSHVGEDWVQVWAPDNRRFVTAAGRKVPGCRIWGRDGKMVAVFDTDAPVSAAAWSPDGSRILFAHGDTVSIADPEPGGVVQRIAVPPPNPDMPSFGIGHAWWYGNDHIAVSHASKLQAGLRVWSVKAEAAQPTLLSFPNGLSCVATAPDGKESVVGDEAGAASLLTDEQRMTAAPSDSRGMFMPVGMPALLYGMSHAKENDGRWFSREPRGQLLLEEQGYDHAEASLLSLAMTEPNLAILAKGMMKGIYLYDHGHELAYRWVNTSDAVPIDVHQGMTFDVAISYSRQDLGDVRSFHETFEKHGLKVFWIDVDVLPEDPIWEMRFFDGVFCSYYFMPIVTQNYFSGYATITEYIECSDAVMETWGTSFFCPMIALYPEGTETLDKALTQVPLDRIRIDQNTKDKIAIAGQLSKLFGFSGLDEVDRLATFLKSCATNSRASRIIDFGFLEQMADRIAWYRPSERDDGTMMVDLFLRSHMDDIYFRFFLTNKNMIYISPQREASEGSIRFDADSLSVVKEVVGL